MNPQIDVDVQGYIFPCPTEATRSERIVRVGAIQNKIVLPTTEPIVKQREALFQRIKEIIDLAGANKINILCLQEAWRKNPAPLKFSRQFKLTEISL